MPWRPDKPITLTLVELPHHSLAPRWTALSLAGLIVLAGVWAATRPRRPGARAKPSASGSSPAARSCSPSSCGSRTTTAAAAAIARDTRRAAKSSSRRSSSVYGALDDPDDPVGVAA